MTALRAGRRGRKPWWLPSLGLLVPVLLASFPISASASESGDAAVVDSESEFRNAWANPRRTAIELADDIFLRHCKTGEPIRESARPMVLDGNGHTIRQVCFEKRVLRQDGTGYVLLKNVALTRGGSDGPVSYTHLTLPTNREV